MTCYPQKTEGEALPLSSSSSKKKTHSIVHKSNKKFDPSKDLKNAVTEFIGLEAQRLSLYVAELNKCLNLYKSKNITHIKYCEELKVINGLAQSRTNMYKSRVKK